MAYKFNCTKCGHELIIKWLKPNETAKCHNCGLNVKVPLNAPEIANDLVPLPGPVHKESGDITGQDTCPTCKYLEKIDAAEFEEALSVGLFGACHRYPPGLEGRYPFVTPADWCGEYEKKE